MCTRLHSAITIGDWKTEFEQLIATHSGQERPQLAKTVCQEMYTRYPDITWVVLVYEPISGIDKHQVMAHDQTHYVFHFHGHHAIISRYAGEAATTDIGLETGLYASFTPNCYKYCHDPACWNSYYHVNADQTARDTYSKLSPNSITAFMLLTIQNRFNIYNFAGRRDSSTGVINGGPFVGTNLWDTRVLEAQIKTTCDNQYAKLIVLGDKSS